MSKCTSTCETFGIIVSRNCSAAIYYAHFDATDLERKVSRCYLRPGAIPTYHMPKVKQCIPTRKPPAARTMAAPTTRHTSRDDLWKSVAKLSVTARGVLLRVRIIRILSQKCCPSFYQATGHFMIKDKE